MHSDQCHPRLFLVVWPGLLVTGAKCGKLLRNFGRIFSYLPFEIPTETKIVLYHGSVGPDHGLETAIKSMPKWPLESMLVIKGRVRNEYADSLRSLALAVGVSERTFLHDPGFQSTEDHYAFLSGADVGWTVLQPSSNAWRYSALASNKRFECMSLGLPQISDNGNLLPELIEGNGCGICIPHDSTEAAAKAVNELLSNSQHYQQVPNRPRNLYHSQYNYDMQFAPVFERLQ